MGQLQGGFSIMFLTWSRSDRENYVHTFNFSKFKEDSFQRRSNTYNIIQNVVGARASPRFGFAG